MRTHAAISSVILLAGCVREPPPDAPDVDTGRDTGEAAPEEDSAEADTGTSAPVDHDGDGLTETDGDCDDADATRYPDAPEVPGDRIDQDCDDLVDEIEACATGGDFASVQQAIDAAPDGGTVEICAGVWDQETLIVVDKRIALVGAGNAPGDVVLASPSASSEPLLGTDGSASLELRRMALRPSSYAVRGWLEGLVLDEVDIEGGSGTTVWVEEGPVRVEVTRSRIASNVMYVGGYVVGTVRATVFEDADVGFSSVPGMGSYVATGTAASAGAFAGGGDWADFPWTVP